MKSYKIWYDEEHEVARFKIFVMLTAEDVHEYIPGLNKLLEGKEHRYVLADLTENPPGFLDRSARKAFKLYAKSMDWDKIAFYGAKPMIKMMAKMAVAALGKYEITKFFETREEALAWLKKDAKR